MSNGGSFTIGAPLRDNRLTPRLARKGPTTNGNRAPW